jgi:hypothetical protein
MFESSSRRTFSTKERGTAGFGIGRCGDCRTCSNSASGSRRRTGDFIARDQRCHSEFTARRAANFTHDVIERTTSRRSVWIRVPVASTPASASPATLLFKTRPTQNIVDATGGVATNSGMDADNLRRWPVAYRDEHQQLTDRSNNKKRKELPEFVIGDLVWCLDFTPQADGKLAKHWRGPWTVVSKSNDVSYTIRRIGGQNERRRAHREHLSTFKASKTTPPDLVLQREPSLLPLEARTGVKRNGVRLGRRHGLRSATSRRTLHLRDGHLVFAQVERPRRVDVVTRRRLGLRGTSDKVLPRLHSTTTRVTRIVLFLLWLGGLSDANKLLVDHERLRTARHEQLNESGRVTTDNAPRDIVDDDKGLVAAASRNFTGELAIGPDLTLTESASLEAVRQLSVAGSCGYELVDPVQQHSSVESGQKLTAIRRGHDVLLDAQ